MDQYISPQYAYTVIRHLMHCTLKRHNLYDEPCYIHTMDDFNTTRSDLYKYAMSFHYIAILTNVQNASAAWKKSEIANSN